MMMVGDALLLLLLLLFFGVSIAPSAYYWMLLYQWKHLRTCRKHLAQHLKERWEEQDVQDVVQQLKKQVKILAFPDPFPRVKPLRS